MAPEQIELQFPVLQEFDLRVVAGGRTNPTVAGDQRSVKKLSQSYVGSIIGGEIVAQLPDSG